jgi:hypothetical protein
MLGKLTRATKRLARPARSAAAPFEPTPDDPFPAGAHPLDHRKSGLSDLGWRVAIAAAEALLADVDGAGRLVPPDGATVDRVVRKLDLWLGTGSLQLQNGFAGLCVALDRCPVLVLKSPTPFSRLPLAERVRALEALEDHESGLFAMLATAFKVPLATAAFEEEPLLRETGFDRPTLSSRRSLTKGSR